MRSEIQRPANYAVILYTNDFNRASCFINGTMYFFVFGRKLYTVFCLVLGINWLRQWCGFIAFLKRHTSALSAMHSKSSRSSAIAHLFAFLWKPDLI